MSLDTWKEKFYPVDASEFREGLFKRFTKIDTIEHSLTKWKGLTDENLKEHGLKHATYYICTDLKVLPKDAKYQSLRINSKTCSLCVRYYNLDKENSNSCNECPISDFKVAYLKNNMDHLTEADLEFNCCQEYDYFLALGDPKPMIDLLQDTLNYVKDGTVPKYIPEE